MRTRTPPVNGMPDTSPDRRRLRRLDMIGLALFAGAVGWTYLSSGTTDAAHRTAAVFAAAGGAVVVGRLLGRLAGWLVPAVIAMIAAGLWIDDPSGVTSHLPLVGPFSYANAKGAFFMIAAACALAAVGVSGRPLGIVAGLVVAIPFVLVPFASQARAPALLIATVPILGLIAYAILGSKRGVAVLGGVFAAALITTAVLGANYDAGNGGRVVDRLVNASITERRLALWSEAGTMMKEDPLEGVGAGRFGALSPTALADRDARWAHNAFLQQGAEAGVPGFILIVALFGWAFVRLSQGAEDIRPVFAGIALAAVGIHATLDYVMHFPAIPVAAAAVVGSGSAIRKRKAVAAEAED